MKAVLLAVALAGCGATYQASAPHRRIPIACHVVDVAAFSAGSMVGLNEWSKPPWARDEPTMYGAFSIALAVWLTWWFTDTQ